MVVKAPQLCRSVCLLARHPRVFGSAWRNARLARMQGLRQRAIQNTLASDYGKQYPQYTGFQPCRHHLKSA